MKLVDSKSLYYIVKWQKKRDIVISPSLKVPTLPSPPPGLKTLATGSSKVDPLDHLGIPSHCVAKQNWMLMNDIYL